MSTGETLVSICFPNQKETDLKQNFLAVALSLGLIGATVPASAQNVSGSNIKHVLLVSIDGMHAVDYENCVASKTCPNLAALGKTGVNYTRTTTSRPSDSFPGLMALVTGGSPRTVGAFYDVAYDRVLAPPKIATGNGLPAGSCLEGQINGTQTEYEEGVEIDQTKLNAVVNQINGKNHLGTSNAPVPVILGMNFQAVSVGEKLVSPAALPADRSDINSGGYEDAQGTPRPLMMKEIVFVDGAIGQMVSALKHEGLLDSTAIIITAKHGQSPIDPNRFFPIPGKTNNGEPPSAVLLPPNPNLLPAVYSDPTNGLGIAEDDISQIWLANSSQTGNAVAALENAATAIGLGQIYYGSSLNTL